MKGFRPETVRSTAHWTTNTLRGRPEFARPIKKIAPFWAIHRPKMARPILSAFHSAFLSN